MALKSMIILVAAYALNLLVSVNNAEKVNIPNDGNNLLIGMTLDSFFKSGYPTPFTDESVAAFEAIWNEKQFTTLGAFRMKQDIITSNRQRLEMLDISGTLETSFMGFSGDAHLSYLDENVVSDLDVSVMVRAFSEGKKKQLTVSELNVLQLKDTSIETLEEFEKVYGEYLITGFMYGGEVVFEQILSATNSTDKMDIAGGLGLVYNGAGFSMDIGGGAKYNKSDISKSIDSRIDYRISPNAKDPLAFQLVDTLSKIATGKAQDEDTLYGELAKMAQSLLVKDHTDPIQAVIVPLSSIGAVADKFAPNPNTAVECRDVAPFIEFLNEMYMGVAALSKQLKLVEDQWRKHENDQYPVPWKTFGQWGHRLRIFRVGMLSLNTMEDIISKSKEYYSIYLDIEWDADVLAADSFIEITRSGMKMQFQNAIMKPYEQMLIGNGISPTPVPSPIPAPIVTSGPTPNRAPKNLFCDSSSWNIIKGNWKYDPKDCVLQNTDSGAGNIVWFGSADGHTPSSQYIHDEFTLTVTFSLQSGSNAGLIFRTGESSTTNDEGPSYYLAVEANVDKVFLGTMDDGWKLRNSADSTIDYDTEYTLSVHAAGDIYNVYLDGVLVMEDITRTEFSGGSFGVRTYLTPATFYSLAYEYSAAAAAASPGSLVMDQFEPASATTNSTTESMRAKGKSLMTEQLHALNVMTVSMPSSNNWEIGMTMDSNFARKPSPFTTESVEAFQLAWETKKEEGKWDQSGTFEMTTRLVQSQEDKLETIGVEGSLELSYMMFSGDAHLEFAKNNIDSALDVSLIVKANSYGRKGQMGMSETNKLKLKETTAADLEEFQEQYGEYLIVGFEYGGEIMFQSTHSVRTKEDKLKVAGGLSMSYESAGFSVEGSVDGDFSTEDVKRSYDSKSDQLIRPNIVSDEVSQILIDLQKLAAGDPSTENFESLSSNAQRLLGGDKLDPIKAVVVALDSVDAVHSLYVDSPEYEDTVAFMQFLNIMFVEVKALKKQLLTVEGGWDQYAPNEKPLNVIANWDYKLTVFLNEMKSFNQRTEIIGKAGVYNLIEKKWNATVMTAKSFVNITKRGLALQFDSAIMKPYQDMIDHHHATKPLKDMGNPEPCNECLTECQGDCDSDNDCKGELLCWQRDDWSTPIPPGCYGTPHFKMYDYCWDPRLTKPLVPLGDDPSGTLGQCEGDCDHDDECSGGMKCYHREDCGTGCVPPGCSGTPGNEWYDYCYGGTEGVVSSIIASPDAMDSWAAEDWCHQRGREMISIHSDFENSVALSYCPWEWCWTGGYTYEVWEGAWKWNDGSAWDYTNWIPGQPNINDSWPVCVVMQHRYDSKSGQWDDSSCDWDQAHALCSAAPAMQFQSAVSDLADNVELEESTPMLGKRRQSKQATMKHAEKPTKKPSKKHTKKMVTKPTLRPTRKPTPRPTTTEPGHTTTSSAGAMVMDSFDPNDIRNVEEPMNGNWSHWYQLHYYDLVVICLSMLVVFCTVNLCLTLQQREQTPYGVVSHFDTESECDVAAIPIVQ